MKIFFKYLKNYRKQLIVGPSFKLIEAIFELIVPLVMARIIDIGVKNQDVSYTLKMGLVLLILAILGMGCALICQYNAAKASQGFGTELRNDLFKHILSFSNKELDNFSTGSLITRLNSDTEQLQRAVAMLIRLVIRSPFLVIGSAIMAIMISPKISIIFIVAIILIGLVFYIVMKKSVPLYKSAQESVDEVSVISRENLSGVRVVRAFNKQEEEKERFKKATARYEKISLFIGKLSSLLNPLNVIIMNIAIVLILWFGGIEVSIGSLTQGEIVALVNYMNQILMALYAVANLVILFTKAFASGKRVSDVLNTKTTIIGNEKNKGVMNLSLAPAVEFSRVSFAYESDKDYAVENLSLTIENGQSVGIIGGTGAGKSTIINLIPRFFDTTKGDVFVRGRNVKEYSLDDLRGMVGVVPQQALLFSGTIRENMKWGNASATDEDIYNALEIARAKDFVDEMPEKLDTVIYQGGKNLSGGQKQRLTIARALVKKPEILILDDSLSALDFKTDAELREQLKEKTNGMTTFTVSQRAHSIKASDIIIVLDDGEIKGIGKHNELYENCMVYKEICDSQISSEEVKQHGNH